jgi:hypothetical protein
VGEIRIIQISEKEYKVGENRVFLSGTNKIFVVPKGDQSEEIANLQFEVNQKLTSLVKEKVNYLIDLNECGKNPPAARKIWNKINESDKTGKIAAYGMHPVARVIAMFVISFSNRNDIQFFSTKEEAEDWIK